MLVLLIMGLECKTQPFLSPPGSSAQRLLPAMLSLPAALWGVGFYTARDLLTRVSPGSLASPRSEIRHRCLVVEEADAVHGHGHAVAPRAGQHGLVLHRAAGLHDELDAELGGDVHVVREGEERV